MSETAMAANPEMPRRPKDLRRLLSLFAHVLKSSCAVLAKQTENNEDDCQLKGLAIGARTEYPLLGRNREAV